MQDNNWAFDVNLTGISAAGVRPPVTENYYNGTISEAYIDPTRNPNRVIFRVAFTDAGFEGVIRSTGLMKPGSTQKDNRGYWRALLESCGYNAAQLDNNLNLQAGHFVGRPCKIYFKPKDENALDEKSQYDRLDFLSPATWDIRKQQFNARQAAQASGTASHAAVINNPAPTNTGSALGAPQTVSTIPANGAAPKATASFAGPSMSAADLRAMVQNN